MKTRVFVGLIHPAPFLLLLSFLLLFPFFRFHFLSLVIFLSSLTIFVAVRLLSLQPFRLIFPLPSFLHRLQFHFLSLDIYLFLYASFFVLLSFI